MRFLIISVFAVIFCCLPSMAQQTVFNVPSADVTPEGAIFLQHDHSSAAGSLMRFGWVLIIPPWE